MLAREIAPAKLNLALHVRGKLPDGRHAIETIFAFCTDGDRLSAADAGDISLDVTGPFGSDIAGRKSGAHGGKGLAKQLAASQGRRNHARKEPARGLRDRRRVGRRCRDAATSHVAVGHRSKICRAGRPFAR